MRVSVIAMDATMKSNLLALRAGMMPLQSCTLHSQSTSISAQIALPISTSNPFMSPLSAT